jgi:regulator of sigma E protease
VTSINGEKISYWRDLQPRLLRALGDAKGAPIELEVRNLSDQRREETPVRKVSVQVPAGWDEKTDLIDWMGLESAELYIFEIKKNSPASAAGLQSGDRVLAINGQPIENWSGVLETVKGFDPALPGLDFTVRRAGEESTFQMKPEMTKLMTKKGQEERRFTIGIVSGLFPVNSDPVFRRTTNPIDMLQVGLHDTLQWTEFVAMSFVRLVTGAVSPKNIGGVITIGRVASHSFAAGLSTFLRTMAIISINLFLLNLLPVPVLDGGHLVFYAIEALKGAPLSMRKMELAQQVGLMLLMLLMVFALFNDISNLFFGPW